jgi:acetate kinase
MHTILGFLLANFSRRFEDEVAAVGHRIVHGMTISEPSLLTEAVIEQIQEAAVLAPLHNRAGLQGIRAAQEVFGMAVPQVCICVRSSSQVTIYYK